MSFTDTSVPKQYVLVQDAEPTGQFSGQIWFKPTGRLTYIYQNDEWNLITLDISQEVSELYAEIINHELAVIELQANASVTPIDHDTLLSDTFSDADGYKDSVNTTDTTANFNTDKYQRTNASAFVGFDDASLDADLRAYYNFEQATGNLTDLVGDADGTNSNVTQDADGKILKGYRYNGTTSKTELTAGLGYAGTGSISFSFWLKRRSTGTGKIVIGQENTNTNSTNGEWIIRGITTEGLITLNARVNGTNYSAPNVDTPYNEWCHVVFVWDKANNRSRSYLNATQVGTGTDITGAGANNFGDVAKKVTLSYVMADYGYSDIDLDEFGVWTKALSGDDITKLYNDTAGLSYDTTAKAQDTKKIFIDLPTITGSVLDTQLVINGTIETGASIKYKMHDDTESTAELNLNTKNQYSLTNNPEKIEILLVPKTSGATTGNPSIKTYCLKIWKSGE